MTRALGLALALAGATATGCTMAHTEVIRVVKAEEGGTPAPGPIAHVYANSWGLYCFAAPVFTGGHTGAGEGGLTWFSDTVTTTTVVEMVRARAKALGATHLSDLQSGRVSEWSSTFMIFWIVEAQASANAWRVAEGEDPPPGAIPVDS